MLACLNLSGVTVGMGAHASMSSITDWPKQRAIFYYSGRAPCASRPGMFCHLSPEMTLLSRAYSPAQSPARPLLS
ncbi:hypothetical protein CB373_22180 [Salmonella enterica subsp. enterica serovar Westminster]|nr:hypothetical protein [Salmonella enterica subsp. enterica serovar Westminster]